MFVLITRSHYTRSSLSCPKEAFRQSRRNEDAEKGFKKVLTGSSSREMAPTELFFNLCLSKANQKRCPSELAGVLWRNRAKRMRIYYREDLCD